MAAPTFLELQYAMGGVPSDGVESAHPTLRCCRPSVLHFGDAASEYLAATTDAAVFDVSDRRQLEFTGRDRQAFLHNFCTNDIKRLAPGSGCEAFVTSVKGRILAHTFVFVENTSLWIDAGPGDAESDLTGHFERYVFSEDVQVRGRTADRGVLLLSGPASGHMLTRLCPTMGTLQLLAHTAGEVNGLPCVVRRVDLLGQTGYALATERSELSVLWQALVAAGARPSGAEAFHALRLAARSPIHGVDLTDENLAQEAARTQQAISFTKGCYLGQEPIARIDALGHVNRVLCRLKIASAAISRPGDAVTSVEGQHVGSITSAAQVPGTAYGIALGMVRTSHSRPGTRVVIRCDLASLMAEVW